jgi:hypothetical protein
MKYFNYLLAFAIFCVIVNAENLNLKKIHREANPSSNPLPSKWINGPANSFSVLHTNSKHKLAHVNMIVQNTYKDNTAEFTKKRLAKKLKKK